MRGPRTAARILVDQLLLQGVDRVFCVPGESFLAVLDALHDCPEIELVTCRHEGGAAMMAEAYGKLTGRPGIVFCSRGPGATNASSGLHVAFQDSTPMIMFIGQNPRGVMTREGFQEIDYRCTFGTQAKAVLQLEDAARTAEHVTRAFQLANSGRPGPVVISLPEDVLTEIAETADGRPTARFANEPSREAVSAVRALLTEARRPVVMLGGSGWTGEAVAAFRRFAEGSGLPVTASFRRQDLLDNDSSSYIGELGLGPNPRLVQTMADADLILVVGARLGEIGTNGYTIMDIPCPRQRLIHVYPGPDEIGHVYQPELGIVSDPASFALALAAGGAVRGDWDDWRKAARADFEAWTAPRTSPGAIQMCEIMAWLDENLPEDTIYTNGAGNFTVWLHRFHRYRRFGTQVAPICGSMGYGIPAALAAKFARPEASVICIAGDGDFQMTCTELATAAAHGLKIRILILNNGMLGTIRMHQERHYPARVSGTDLSEGNPDFTALAKSFGAYAERIERTEGFAPAFARAHAHDGPAVLEIMIDPEALTPAASLSQIRAASLRTN
ncbi:thiamine pyrophosphate-binding protein [Paracoccus versutus]|uniref:Acetolactate synthase large subunit n=1 Tax=Paracoccus versutus TaxID=34007 RepID=A0A3D9XNH5_PARVE|nr:thiamine pyrophosphate-binding protein [Paracoccus versutus]REF68439.1 acetolactate synthase large subunit [Paracoccus versutus]WGR56639.1 thiamine pyrophosphate-binding protein [Paracoccus versutus]WGR61484.1 thiamine pyrophosphate-binding protein [Paracoccus ferrooxidans]